MPLNPTDADRRSPAARPHPAPVRIIPPRHPLPTARFLRTLIRNPIQVWPQAVYEQGAYRRRLFNRETLFVMDPDLVRAVLVDQAEKFGKSPAMLRALEPALGLGLLTADGAHWRWQRRAAAPIFRHERLLDFVPAMIAAAEGRRDAWRAGPPRTLDIAHEMMRTTFAIIVDTMLSGPSDIHAARVEQGITDYLESTSWTVAFALLGAPHWLPYPGQRRAEQAREHLRREVLRVVAERRASRTVRPDLISLLLAAQDPDTGQAMGDRDLADNLLTFITAGHETTALALTWTFYLLDLHPEIAARVRDEIAAVTGGGSLQPEHLARLDYTRQVLQEAMRLYPPAPIVVREALEDVDLGGERVAAGCSVYVPIYAIHRHAALWNDPDQFDPDRFAPEPNKARHRYSYLPFGAGPRICIGMSFAMLEAVAILATLLPAVDLRAAGRDPSLKLRVTLRPAHGLPMHMAPRPAMEKGSCLNPHQGTVRPR